MENLYKQEAPNPEKDFSINITLVSVHPKERKNLIKLLKENFFNRHRLELSNYSKEYQPGQNNFFVPYAYYMFGNYDLAFITLIDNYTFSQKLVLPHYPKVMRNKSKYQTTRIR